MKLTRVVLTIQFLGKVVEIFQRLVEGRDLQRVLQKLLELFERSSNMATFTVNFVLSPFLTD